jgi:preprotein translocase subunit YajC
MESASVIWLQAAGPSGIESMLVPILLMIVPLYFLLSPRAEAARARRCSSITKGDRVVTVGGIRGTVVGLTDDVLTLEIGKGSSVKIEVERARVERRLEAAKGEAK